ncbi:DUF499 domain-containing protein [Rudanella paleaurantiibacter]|uniref:DUF499 domain-containing protein n=1 Tax=Rudanella paleaurantiibacter TaxID=2614655 RepID=A0A7J5TST7_9BACT|nr:DUF499 domain-containing protein [Rudanella paleaurantiibacter]KAB7726656.1 DUF499 domain-containing protein [Rudanella paleaurantiibacter]
MALKAWHQIITPREDLRENKPLDASEFAVHLDHVRAGTAPVDYVDPERFFQRTYLTQTLLDMAAQTVRRLNGITTETSPVFNLTTQFGGGKTHSLTMLYHLAKCGTKALDYQGIGEVVRKAGVADIPVAKVGIFVGTEFGSVSGRGDGINEPNRKTPWGELAYQIGEAAGYELIRQHDESFTPPSGDDLKQLFDPNTPYLLLYDELLNYVSRHRHYKDLAAQFYNFLQTLTEFVRSRSNIVLAVSIPASEMEMNAEDQADYDRFKKMLDRLGKPLFMSAGKETTEIIRRRLFEWQGLPPEAKPIIGQYVNWVQEHRSQLPGTFNADAAREQFEATYPFHPQVLSLFERKWQSLPRFQQTRGVLRLLALWVARAYNDGYQRGLKDTLISLGTAPLDDQNFRAAVFGQLGEDRLEAAVTTDIAGKADSHAIRMDAEAIESVRKSRLNRKCATIIFFESNGGQTGQVQASIPEIKFNVGEPDLDIGHVDSVLQTLLDNCYYLTGNNNKFKFSTQENLIKRFTDRKASIAAPAINELVEAEVRKVFEKGAGIERIYFPERNNQVTDRPALSLVVMHPSKKLSYPETKALLEDIVRNNSQTTRTFKSGLLFCVADDDSQLREDARKKLAWEAIQDDAADLRFDEEQRKQIAANIKRAGNDLVENVWKSYRTLVYLDRDNVLQEENLGLIHSSQSRSLPDYMISHLLSKGEVVEDLAPTLLVRNWPPAFVDGWSIRNVRDTLYASPKFPRPLKADSIRHTIAKGVSNGLLAYVGKVNGRYEPFLFNQPLQAADVELSDDMYILTATEAQKHKEPRRLVTLKVVPPSYTTEPGQSYTFMARGYDQHGDEIIIDDLTWETTSGTIDPQTGKLTVGQDIGTYRITARSGSIVGTATLTVEKRVQPVVAEPGNSASGTQTTNNSEKPSSATKKVSWSNQVEPKKWNVLYTKVLAKLVNNPNLKIKVSFEVEDDTLTDQKIEEIRAALKEMGMDDAFK